MAEALDFSTVQTTNISGSETGKRELPYPVSLKYARLVGISTDILIDDELNLPDKSRRS
jgi:hypothetical protein